LHASLADAASDSPCRCLTAWLQAQTNPNELRRIGGEFHAGVKRGPVGVIVTEEYVCDYCTKRICNAPIIGPGAGATLSRSRSSPCGSSMSGQGSNATRVPLRQALLGGAMARSRRLPKGLHLPGCQRVGQGLWRATLFFALRPEQSVGGEVWVRR
jgi:hypothetical protein